MKKNQPPSTLSEYSPITNAVLHFFAWIKWLSPMKWLSFINPLFRSRNALTQDEVLSKDFARGRGRSIEFYLIGWWVIEIIIIILICVFRNFSELSKVFVAISAIRIIEIIQVTVNATLFDALSGRPDELVASRTRMIILSGINFLELITCFGIIYSENLNFLHGAGQPLTAFYFSIITQLTIGYGDVFPIGWLRIIAALQGLVNILFIILIFGRFMASFPQIRSLFDENKRV